MALENLGQSQRRELVAMNAYAAQLCHEMKRYEQGLQYALQALAIDPYEPTADYYMALIYKDMGDRDKAVTHLARSLYVYEPADKFNLLARRVWNTEAAWKADGIPVQ